MSINSEIARAFHFPFQDVNLSSDNHMYWALSGRMLSYTLGRCCVVIEDYQDSAYRLHAKAEQEVLLLNVRTRRQLLGRTIWRHPDLFAGKFIGDAICYLEGNGNEFDSFRGMWTPGSDNWRMFMKHYKQFHDMAEAARQTWSGKTMAQYGFTEISSEQVRLVQDCVNECKHIEALFRRG